MLKPMICSVFLLCFSGVFGQKKMLTEFNTLVTSGNVQVELIKGEQPKAEFVILKGMQDDLVMEIDDAVLTIKIKNHKSGMINRSETKAKITLYYQNLQSIDCSAGSTVKADKELKTEKLYVDVSSGASTNLMINSKYISVNASSGAKAVLSGTVSDAKYDASSGGKIEASGLAASVVDSNVSSGAGITLSASKKLKADASSGGSIRYKGKPESSNINAGMSGSITQF